MRRVGIWLFVSLANRARLEAILQVRNSTRRAVGRAKIVLATEAVDGKNDRPVGVKIIGPAWMTLVNRRRWQEEIG